VEEAAEAEGVDRARLAAVKQALGRLPPRRAAAAPRRARQVVAVQVAFERKL
jgi:hypothetical protein